MKQLIFRLFSHPIAYVLLSVILLSLPWYGAGGYWAMVGFVPLLLLHKRLTEQGKKGFLWWVALTIVVWHCATCWWVAYATLLAVPVIPIGTLLMLIPSWILFYYCSKQNNRALSYPILVTAWVLCEWWLAQGDVSFSWLALGGAFANDPYAVQWYSATGLYGGSAWVMITNILIFTVLTKRKVSIALFTSAWIVLPIIFSMVIYNSYKEPQNTIEVTIIQPNVDAYEKFTLISAEQQTTNLLQLAAEAPTSTALYIAPETALVASMDERTMYYNDHVSRLQDFLRQRKSGATLIVGASTYDDTEFYNTALYIDSTSIKTYHKGKLVLGVETVPQWLTWVAEAVDLGGYVGSLGRQKERTVFSSEGGVKSGAAICYESIHGNYFADWARGGAQMMAVITNDGWWGDTPGYRQHFSYSRIRAIETRRAIARSANTGISGVINGRGDVLQRLGWDERGVIVAQIPLNEEVTLYMRLGDLTVRLSAYILSLCLLYAVAVHFRRRA